MHCSLLRAVSLVAVALAPALAPALAQGASFTPLGDLPGSWFASDANGVSADGSVVVGYSRSASESTPQGRNEAFRWTSAGGMVGLGDLPGGIFMSVANGVSADGLVVVGNSSSVNHNPEAFRWTSGGGMVAIGPMPGGGFTNKAWAASANGSVVVGDANSENSELPSAAFRWTPGGGVTALGGGLPSVAWDTFGDGSVVVGQFTSAYGSEAFRWTSAGGLVGLGDLSGGGFGSEAHAISADGSVIVGYGTVASGTDSYDRAVSWTDGGAPVQLAAGDFSNRALDVSQYGSVIVGYGYFSGLPEAFVWTAQGGMQRLDDILVANGVTAHAGWTLTEARAVSANGLTVVGVGTNPSGDIEAFVATIPPPDSDGDGVADPGDNCMLASNTLAGTVPGTAVLKYQLDSDGDGYGNRCDGDVNNSGGTVTTTDYTILRSVINKAYTFSTNAARSDLNGSGMVDTTDYAIFRTLINKVPGPSGLVP